MAEVVDPPAGTEINFDSGSPTSGPTHINGSGTTKVPSDWNRAHVKMVLYKVKADGTKGDFVSEKESKEDDPKVWAATIVGLPNNTEYWVEARMKVVKQVKFGEKTQEAYKSVEKKQKTTVP